MNPIVNVLCVTGGAALAVAMLLVSSSGASAPEARQQMSNGQSTRESQSASEEIVASRRKQVEVGDRSENLSRGHSIGDAHLDAEAHELGEIERIGLRDSLDLLLPKYVPFDARVVTDIIEQTESANPEENADDATIHWIVEVEHADVDPQRLSSQLAEHLEYLRAPDGREVTLNLTVVHPTQRGASD